MNSPHGLLAQFSSAEQLLQAALRTRSESPGIPLEAFSPFPIQGLDEALGAARNPIPALMGLGGLLAGAGTFLLEGYSAVMNYPINVGGRPLGSWPAFVPPAVEMALLGAALFGVVAMLTGNGLPRLHHPLFDVPEFERASTDGFFLLLRGPGEDMDATRSFLQTLSPMAIYEVPS
ncbi:MAG TPA: DUF3341 domain-containing protein [Steroidobacteraceae bacterium]|nr:DUF3341 domain-containing protein [Steroidobacteraceae bacterium]